MFFRSRVLPITILALASVTAAAAQGGGPAPTGQAATLQLFADKLKLNEKTQIPAVETIFNEAAKTAAPIGVEMARARERLLNAELAGQADEITAAQAANVTAAAKMAIIETHAYRRVFAFLKPNQQEKTSQAFPLMAGLFQPVPARSMSRPPGRTSGVLFDVAPAAAQRGGGGRGGGGGGFGGAPQKTRLESLTDLFSLDKAQVSSVKTLLGDAGKSETREALAAAYAMIGAAVAAAAAQEDIDSAIQRYAVASAAMTGREMTALANVLRSLSEKQRANTVAMTTAVALMRGAFVDNKWNVAPGSKTY